LHPLAYAVALAWCGVPLVALAQADAQSAWDAPPALRRSPQLQETLPAEVRPQLPVFVSGDRITGQPDVKAVIDGNAELRRGDTVIRADRLEYTVPDDLAQAQGQVHINRAGNTYDGSELALHVDAFKGFFSDARYRFLQTGAHGDATRVDFLDRDRAVVHNATYTTCQRDDSASWEPDWVLRAQSIRLDNVEEVGTAEGAVLEFKGVSVLPIPHITFPLSDKRKSGLLPPTVGLDSRNGLEYIQPYYWNIAPNRDATLRGAIMAKRGIEVGGEFRYLETNYQGQVDASLMPTDSQRDRVRWGYSAQHQGMISTPMGGVGLNLNLNRVSDDNYWRDFGRAALPLRQRLLPSDATASWAGGNMSAQVRTLKWQALQDVASAHRAALQPHAPAAVALHAPGSGAGPGFQHGGRHHSLRGGPCAAQPGRRPAQLCAGPAEPPLSGAGGLRHPQAAAARHAIPVRQPIGQRGALGQPRPAHLQPGRRAGVRARRTFAGARLHADAGAPRVLHLHALSRPEPPAAV
jgi:Organic solvent tolerance protein OstA